MTRCSERTANRIRRLDKCEAPVIDVGVAGGEAAMNVIMEAKRKRRTKIKGKLFAAFDLPLPLMP